MAANKKIDYKSGLDSLISKVNGCKMENPALELVSSLMNAVNADIIASIEESSKSAKQLDLDSYHHFARKAITKVFPGNLANNGLSEAYKQLSLLQSGCMISGETSGRVKKQLKRGRESSRSERATRDQMQIVQSRFRKGVNKAFTNFLPNISVDPRAEQLLSLRLHTFAKMIADQASNKFEKKDELQPADLSNIVSEYLGPNALKAANSEGFKNVALFENGLIDFKPRRTIKSGWSQETLGSRKQISRDQEKIFASVFKTGIKSLGNQIDPDLNLDANPQKYLGHILMDLARYLAEKTANTCKKSKILELGNDEVAQAVNETFPEQLRQHAILHASEDVASFLEGLLLYERKQEKPVVRKVKKMPKTRQPPAKRRKKSPKGRSSSTPSKRSSARSSAAKSGKRKGSTSQRKTRVKVPKPKKSVLAPLLTETVAEFFPITEVTLARDATNLAGGILEDVLQALGTVVLLRAEKSGEINRGKVIEAVNELLPKNLAEHAKAFLSSEQFANIKKD